jgi:hypothetical protein
VISGRRERRKEEENGVEQSMSMGQEGKECTGRGGKGRGVVQYRRTYR